MIRLLKRDGSISYGFHNPDGSWVEIPWQDDQPISAPVSSQAQVSTAGNVREFLRQIGRKGGLVRASRHNRQQLAAWGSVRYKNKVV
jgi:hypothetical protein